MDKKKSVCCAWVSGNEENLNRVLLKEAFSRFGIVTKIYVDADHTFAKVYFDDFDKLKLACNRLNGFNSWKITFFQDDYRANYSSPNNSFTTNSRTSFKSTSNDKFGNMEENCVFAGEYVDVHGRPVEVLQAENGQFYVNLDDVRSGGYGVFKKESFENATISKEIELSHLEHYLLNQARKYVLDVKKTFNENEMLGVFERVKAKLESKSTGQFGEGRLINASPNMKNFSITKTNVPSDPPVPSYQPPKELDDNFRPSFSHVKPKPKRDFRFDDRQDRQNGQPSTSDGPRRDIRHDFNNANENRRKPENTSFSEANQSYNMLKPKQSFERMDATENIRSKAVANENVNEEPEKTWEGAKSPVQKSKPLNDTHNSSRERRNINIERIKLEPDGIYKIKVSYIKPNKKSLFYAQHVENLNRIEEILLHVNTDDLNLPEITAPTREMLCVAHFEDCWYRAVVLRGNEPGGGAFVELIDYGNKEIIKTPLREMSEEMKKIPGMAIRVAIHTDSEHDCITLDAEQELEVFVKRHYDDLTHLVEVKRILEGLKLEQEPSSPPSETSSDQEPPQKSKVADRLTENAIEDCFMQLPPSTAKLTDGESVMIVSYTETKFILRNRDTAKNCKELYTHVSAMEKKPIVDPKVDQLVLCSRDGVEGLHRAVIKRIENNVAYLEYLDHYGGETLTLKTLRNVDKLLASIPISTIESPVVDWLRGITDESDIFLTNLVMNKTKLKVVLGGSEFDLLLTEGDETILLSKKIEQLENPPKEEPKVIPEAKPSLSKTEDPLPKQEKPQEIKGADGDLYAQVNYDDMPFVKANIGQGEYVCYNCKEGSVTLLSCEDAEKHIENIIVTETTDTVPHEPGQFEMCLGKFDGGWYRAVIMETIDDTYQVYFVDFGNTEIISKNDIRKFPKELAEIPILGISASFTGIPSTAKVYDRLHQLIPDETMLNVNIKEYLSDDMKYSVEIPSIYDTLKEENLF